MCCTEARCSLSAPILSFLRSLWKQHPKVPRWLTQQRKRERGRQACMHKTWTHFLHEPLLLIRDWCRGNYRYYRWCSGKIKTSTRWPRAAKINLHVADEHKENASGCCSEEKSVQDAFSYGARDDDEKFKTMSEKRDKEIWKSEPSVGRERDQERKEQRCKTGNKSQMSQEKENERQMERKQEYETGKRQRSPDELSPQHRVSKGWRAFGLCVKKSQNTHKHTLVPANSSRLMICVCSHYDVQLFQQGSALQTVLKPRRLIILLHSEKRKWSDQHRLFSTAGHFVQGIDDKLLISSASFIHERRACHSDTNHIWTLLPGVGG